MQIILGFIVCDLILLAVIILLFRLRERDMQFTQAIVEKALLIKQAVHIDTPKRVVADKPYHEELLLNEEEEYDELVKKWKKEAAAYQVTEDRAKEQMRQAMLDAQNEELAREQLRPSVGKKVPVEESALNDN